MEQNKNTAKKRVISKRLGELLIERGIITQEHLQEALSVQTRDKRLLGEILIQLGYVTEEEVMICLTTQFGIPFLPIESYEIDPEIISFVPAELVHRYNFIPIDKIGDLLTIVISDIVSNEDIAKMEEKLECRIECFVTTPTALKGAIEKYYK